MHAGTVLKVFLFGVRSKRFPRSFFHCYQQRGHGSTAWHLQLASWVGRLIILAISLLMWSESQVHSFIIDERINVSLVYYMQQLPDWIIALWWDAFCGMAGHPCGCCSGGVFLCVCFPYSKKKSKRGGGMLLFLAQAISICCWGAVACCHGNYLLIFRQSFPTYEGRVPLSRYRQIDLTFLQKIMELSCNTCTCVGAAGL